MSNMPQSDELDALSLKGRSGFIRIIYATRYSLAGLRAAFQGEAAFRQLLLLNAVLLPLACVVDVTHSVPVAGSDEIHFHSRLYP